MVLLDVNMPKSCVECELHNYHFCDVTKESIENYEEKRAEFCPIKAEIPKDATNGDVIRGLFPKYYQTLLNYLDCTKWWNAPWKGMENEQDD
jgi:hypothetical protein